MYQKEIYDMNHNISLSQNVQLEVIYKAISFHLHTLHNCMWATNWCDPKAKVTKSMTALQGVKSY